MSKTTQCGTADTPEVAELFREHSAGRLGNDTLESGFVEPETIRGEMKEPHVRKLLAGISKPGGQIHPRSL
jgi:hypothetical protein